MIGLRFEGHSLGDIVRTDSLPKGGAADHTSGIEGDPYGEPEASLEQAPEDV